MPTFYIFRRHSNQSTIREKLRIVIIFEDAKTKNVTSIFTQ